MATFSRITPSALSMSIEEYISDVRRWCSRRKFRPFRPIAYIKSLLPSYQCLGVNTDFEYWGCQPEEPWSGALDVFTPRSDLPIYVPEKNEILNVSILDSDQVVSKEDFRTVEPMEWEEEEPDYRPCNFQFIPMDVDVEYLEKQGMREDEYFWCCSKKCFLLFDVVDGKACDVCNNFNFCKCGCLSYIVKSPRKVEAQMLSSAVDSVRNRVNQVTAAVDNTAAVAEEMRQIVDDHGQDARNIIQNVDGITNMARGYLEEFGALWQQISDFLSGFCASPSVMRNIRTILTGIVFSFRSGRWSHAHQAVFTCVLENYFPMTSFVDFCFLLVTCIKNYIAIPRAEAQGPNLVDVFSPGPVATGKYVLDNYRQICDNLLNLTWLRDNWLTLDTLVPTLLSAVAIFIVLLLNGRSMGANDIMTQASLIGRAAKGATDFWGMITKVFAEVDKAICRKLFGKTREEHNLADTYKSLDELFSVMELFKSDARLSDNLFKSDELCKALVVSYELADQYLIKSMTLQHRNLSAKLKEVKQDLKLKYECAKNILASNSGARVPPVVVMLHGEAGVGKTVAFDLIEKKLAEKYYSKQPPQKTTYSRKAENEYWDGYTCQPIVKYDDAFQVVDTIQKPNPEFMEIIRAANSESYQLHMASIGEKTNTYFKGEFILVTTNVPQPSRTCVSIKEPRAFDRRIDFDVEVKVKPEFGEMIGGRNYLQPSIQKIYEYLHPDGDFVEACQKGTLDFEVGDFIYELNVKYYDPVAKDIVKTMDMKDFLGLIYARHTQNEKVHAEKVKLPYSARLPDRYKEYMDELNKLKPVVVDYDDFQDAEDTIEAQAPIYSGVDDMSLAYGRQTAIDHLLGAFNETAGCVKNFVGDLFEKTKKKFADLFNLFKNKLNFDFYGFFVKYKSFIITTLGAVTVMLGSSMYKWATSCALATILKHGGSLTQLIVSKYCRGECKLCNSLKTALSDFNFSQNNRVAQRDLSRYMQTVISTAHNVELEIHPSFLISTYGEIRVRGTPHVQAESYQDKKQVSPRVESYQQKRTVQPVVESHQDKKTVQPVVESHQDKRTVQPVVESFIDDMFDFSSKSNNRRFPDMREIVEAQGCSDDNASEAVNKMVLKNQVRLFAPGSNAGLNGLAIKGRFVLTAAHFVDSLDHVVSVGTVLGSSRVDHNIINKFKIKRNVNNSDLAVIELDCNFTLRSDITPHFPRKSELNSIPGLCENGKNYLCRLGNGNLRGREVFFPFLHSVNFVKMETICTNVKGKTYTTADSLVYDAQTAVGDCGSPYVLFNRQARYSIVGIHVAGMPKTNEGFAQSVCVEDFEGIGDNAIVAQAQMFDGAVDANLPNVLCHGSVKRVGEATQSSFEKSPYYGVFPVKKDLAVLQSDQDLVIKNFLKVTKTTSVLDRDLLDVCENDIISKLSKNRDPSIAVRRVLDYGEAIEGIHECNYIDGLPRGTSPGYPYSLNTGGYVGKTKWLGTGEDYDVSNEELRAHVFEIINLAKDNVVDPKLGLFTASLKDERRTLEKIDALKTRVFCAGNMGLSVAMRMYFAGFVKHLMENRISNEIGLGINCYSYDWDKLAKHLKRTGNNIIAGDFSNFDGSLNSEIISRVSKIASIWYNDGELNAQIRDCLLNYIFNSSVVIGDTMVQLNHSQPSGNVLTTVINCIYNMFIFRYCYLLCCQENHLPMSLSTYNENVSSCFYGDDSIMSISDFLLPYFNQRTITKYMALTGHDYTDETKSKSVQECKKLDEVTFLKRKIVYSDDLYTWISPLDKDTIEDMIMWKRKTLSISESIEQTMKVATMEAALWGREYYDWYVRTIRSFAATHDIEYSVLSHYEAMRFILDQHLKPSFGFNFKI